MFIELKIASISTGIEVKVEERRESLFHYKPENNRKLQTSVFFIFIFIFLLKRA